MKRKSLLHLLTATVTGLAAATMAMSFAGTANSAVDHETCRPDGLYRTPGVAVPYCAVYDTNGREKMGAGHPRRIIGYFTSWRTGKNGAPAYLVNNIPWTQGHPHQLRVRPRRRRQQDLRRQPDRRQQRRHRHDVAGRGGRRDGPGATPTRATSTC